MEDRDNIIVYGHYASGIEANIVKTKLDAHGIPCFLSDENLANLYPSQAPIGVRLHLFSRDFAWANEVLNEDNLSVRDNTID